MPASTIHEITTITSNYISTITSVVAPSTLISYEVSTAPGKLNRASHTLRQQLTLDRRRYNHQFLHGSWAQPLRCQHFYHHTHSVWTDRRPHSLRRSNDSDRIPDRHTPRFNSYRGWWQVDTDRVRHSNIARLNHHQHHQPPRREQHSHKHGDNNLLRDRIELQRHARSSTTEDDSLRNELHHQDFASDLHRPCDLQRLHRYDLGFFHRLGWFWKLRISRRPFWGRVG